MVQKYFLCYYFGASGEGVEVFTSVKVKVGSIWMLIVNIPKFIHPCQVDPIFKGYKPCEGLKHFFCIWAKGVVGRGGGSVSNFMAF